MIPDVNGETDVVTYYWYRGIVFNVVGVVLEIGISWEEAQAKTLQAEKIGNSLGVKSARILNAKPPGGVS